MTAEYLNWPVSLVILTAAAMVIAPFPVPGVAVVVLLAAAWTLATLSLRRHWRSLPGPVRVLHLSIGALSGSAFVALVHSSLPAEGIGVLPGSALMVSGPIAIFVAFSFFRMMGMGGRSVDLCDVIDSVTVVVLPWALVATIVLPWIVGPLSAETRVMVAAIVWASTFLFLAGVLTILARPVAGTSQSFLAVSALGLGGLGWMVVISAADDGGMRHVFPEVVVIPAVAYLIAVGRGELLITASGRSPRPAPMVASSVQDQGRWVIFAAVGMAVAFLTILERSIPLIVAMTAVAALSIARLAAASIRVAAAGRMIDAFDEFLQPLAIVVDRQEIVDRATVAARKLFGSDEVVVEVAGRPELSKDFRGRAGVVNTTFGSAVISRLGDVQICTAEAIPPDRLRSLTRLADITALALVSVDRESGPAAPSIPNSTPTSNASDPELEIWIMVEHHTVIAADPQAPKLLGYDPIDTDGSKLVRAGTQGEPFRSESNGRWLRARVMAGDRPETNMIVVAPTAGRYGSSRFDASSGLPNLHDFELQGPIANAVVIVFYLHDLERVRDSIGTDAGDSFVRRLAVRARRTFRDGHDTVWRGDGAKVIVLSPIDPATHRTGAGTASEPHGGDGASTITWVEGRRAALSAPTALGMSFIAPAISAGFTVVGAAISPAEALQQAEMALMDARDNHPRSTIGFSIDLQARLSREWQIQSLLAAGLDDLTAAGFTVHYQPIIGVADGTVKMVEALARWNQPELGPISPAEFIPIAEKAGVIARIDDFVLARAVEDLERFRIVAPELSIQVNMSPTGLEPSRLAEVAKFVLRQLGTADPGIIVEITESALSNQPMGELHKAFSFLREANLGIAVDDFGTGESNLERMSKLPFTQVKLANQFVRSNDGLLMSNVVNVVHGMGMNCVVEGVETQAQFDMAIRSGADHVQGWHFAAAMPIAEAIQFCRERIGTSADETSPAGRSQHERRAEDRDEADEGRSGDGEERGAVAGDRGQ